MSEPLTLYSRDGCHLCEMAEDLLTAQGVPYTRVEISGDEDLERRYGWDVPVLARGERVLVKGVFSTARVQRALQGT